MIIYLFIYLFIFVISSYNKSLSLIMMKKKIKSIHV